MFLEVVKMENKKKESKYKSQIKHIKANYTKFQIDFNKETLNIFKEICKKNKTTPTTEIKKFVDSYIKNNS